ncbi:hypothetical protein JKF63_02959 [Porcisia hertigi]|uniref:Uncharacterized protein n=1 Tax=Porcisia hertigi TaxID=2761500 RepID=A0A836HER2_9TRYP|nr:hypothetical protein JKF63_02959 [Porcisia hertigi]
MFFAKYYDDPFADDDNDICYAEIVSKGDDSDATADARANCPLIPRVADVSSTLGSTNEITKSACGASTEIPFSTANGSQRASSQAGEPEYEGYIEKLRAELKAANADNNRLTIVQTKLESRVRSLSFEKENAEWQLQQEKERSRALAEKVSALEEELVMMTTRVSSAAHQRDAIPVESSSLPASSSPEGLHAAARTQRCDPNASLEQPRHAQTAYTAGRRGLYERRGETTITTALPQSAHASYEPHDTAPPISTEKTLRSQRRAAAANETIAAQEQAVREKAAAVQVLEAQLLEHSQQRDELTSNLERLERMRTRTVADRKKKAAVERSLEEEEKLIGQIRLELRAYSALRR